MYSHDLHLKGHLLREWDLGYHRESKMQGEKNPRQVISLTYTEPVGATTIQIFGVGTIF